MSVLSNLFANFGASMSIQTMEDELIPTPESGDVFYKYHAIPDGPGMEELWSILHQVPQVSLKNGAYLAGGAARRLLRGESIKGGDVDFFFKNGAQYKLFCDAFHDREEVFRSEQAVTYLVNDIKVQFIKRNWYLSIKDVFQDFDFSACQIATDGEWLAATDQGARDILSNTLRLAPGGRVSKRTIVARMIKYLQHGLLPEPELFTLIVKSGLDVNMAYSMFRSGKLEADIYDQDAEADDKVETQRLNADLLSRIAGELGLGVPK